MDPAASQPFRAELLRHRDDLRSEIEAQGADPDSDEVAFADDAGFADRSHRTEEHSRVIALLGALRSNLTEVERALAKVGSGSYGVCERCGRPIAPERLEALPWAELCIDCKQRVGGA